MATAQLATNGYRIAKSWQYQDQNMSNNDNTNSGAPLNNNTLRPILMANYPPIQSQRNRSAFAGLKRDRERGRRKHSTGNGNSAGNSAVTPNSENQKQPLILPNNPVAGQTPEW